MVEAVRLKGAPVTASVINSIAKGVVIANDRSILIEYGGYLSLNSDWGKNVLYRMEKEGKKMTHRCATTSKLPVAPGIISEVKLDFQRKIKAAQSKHDIPDDLIINVTRLHCHIFALQITHCTNVEQRVVPLLARVRRSKVLEPSQ